MGVLEQLSKEDKKWRAYALKICKNKEIADELVQDMYIKFYKNGYTKTNTSYVYWAIFNLYRDMLRKQKKFIDISLIDIEPEEPEIEPTKVEVVINEKLKEHDEYYSEMALMNADGKALRKLAYLYQKNYSTIHYNVNQIKNSLQYDTDIRDLYLSLK